MDVKPTPEAFAVYCKKYPLCLLDQGFMGRHYDLLGPKIKSRYESASASVPKCTGCPECLFGDCYNELPNPKRLYIATKTQFKPN